MEQWQIYRTRWRDLIASAASILNGIATKFTMDIQHDENNLHQQFRKLVIKAR
jgi:hypothetical protein